LNYFITLVVVTEDKNSPTQCVFGNSGAGYQIRIRGRRQVTRAFDASLTIWISRVAQQK
jgi:hypothetical protein